MVGTKAVAAQSKEVVGAPHGRRCSNKAALRHDHEPASPEASARDVGKSAPAARLGPAVRELGDGCGELCLGAVSWGRGAWRRGLTGKRTSG